MSYTRQEPMPIEVIDPNTGQPLSSGDFGGGGSGTTTVTIVAGGRNTLAAGVAEDVIAAGANAVGIELRNVGDDDVAYVVDGTATGGASERVLLIGETRVFPYKTALRVSAFSANGSILEWETWR